MEIRKGIIAIALAGLGCTGALAQEKADTLHLSREECVAIALQDNPTIKVANLEVKRVDYSRKETLAALWPQIDFSGAYQRSIELQTVSMNMGGSRSSLRWVPTMSGISVSQPRCRL